MLKTPQPIGAEESAPAPSDADRRAPRASVVIPAYNAERTLDRALDSLRAQSMPDWEAIVVENGATDGTLAIARARAEKDGRIRVLSETQAGVSRARNVGIAHARADWLVFLDADDRLAPHALHEFLKAAEHPSAPDIVVGFADIVYTDGRNRRYPRNDLKDPPLDLASQCGIAIVSVMSRTAVVRGVGGFDPALTSSEDWDLWQKVACTGARFRTFDARVAFYHAEAGSLSKRITQTAKNHLEVLARSPERLAASGLEHARIVTLLRHDLPFHQLSFLLWAGVRAIVAGEDPVPLLDLVSPRPVWDLDLDMATQLMADGVESYLTATEAHPETLWLTLGPGLARYLDAALPGAPFTRARAVLLFGVKQRLFGGHPWDAEETSGGVRAISIDLARPLADIDPAKGDGAAEVIAAQLLLDGAPLGLALIPAPRKISAAETALAIDLCMRTTPLAAALRASRFWRRPKFWTAALPALLDPRGVSLRPAALKAILRHRVRHAARAGLRSVAATGTPTPRPSSVSGRVPAPALLAPAADRVPILMYHRIALDSRPGLERYSIRPDAFAAQLRFLKENGWWTPTLAEWADAIETCRPLRGKPILITFDDGYRDFADAAWPELKAAGLGAAMFVVTDKVGAAADWETVGGEPTPLMDWDALAALAADGLEIGSHSASHAPMQRTDVPGLFNEGARSRAAIKSRLGLDAAAFCYPYGQADRTARAALVACGFRIGVSVASGVSTLSSDTMFLPRLTVEPSETLESFARKLAG